MEIIILVIGGIRMSEIEKKDQCNKFYNVALFIDYENVCKILLKQYTNIIRLGFFEKFRQWCANHGRRIVKIAVYCNFDIKDMYESHHQSLLQNYGVETIHTSNQGKNYADLKIAIDVLNSMYTNNNIDEFIIMSNDKNMTPLLNTLRLNKRKASILTTGEAYNDALREFADEQIDFNEVVNTPYNKELFVTSIENRLYLNIVNYVDKSLQAYKNNIDVHKFYGKHYNIEYFLESQSAFHQIMQYEFLNMVKNLYDLKKIVLYENTTKNGVQTGILPLQYKTDFLQLNIIKENDIISNPNIDSLIENKYKEYFPKESN